MQALCSLDLEICWDMYFTEEFAARHSSLTQNPEQIAAHEAPLPVPSSNALVHRSPDSLPVPGSDGGR